MHLKCICCTLLLLLSFASRVWVFWRSGVAVSSPSSTFKNRTWMTKRYEMRTQAAIFSLTGMWGCNWSQCVHLTLTIASITRKGLPVMICCVMSMRIFQRLLLYWTLYSRNHFFCGIFFPASLERDRKIITFIPMPPYFLPSSAFSFNFDGSDLHRPHRLHYLPANVWGCFLTLT